MRPEAYIEAERVEYDKAMREIDYLWTCPTCASCGKHIADDHCYILYDEEPWESCICEDCMKSQIRKFKRTRDLLFSEWVIDEIELRRAKTPHREV